jgi:hypothetical protein
MKDYYYLMFSLQALIKTESLLPTSQMKHSYTHIAGDNFVCMINFLRFNLGRDISRAVGSQIPFAWNAVSQNTPRQMKKPRLSCEKVNPQIIIKEKYHGMAAGYLS